MDKNEQIVSELLPLLGGKENVSAATHCMTRLRLNLKDEKLVDVDAIKKINGVAGTQFVGRQLQVIIGTNVSKVYDIFVKEAGVAAQAAIDENLDAPKKKGVDAVFDYISGTMSPILPAFIAGGFFKMLATVLGPGSLNLISAESDLSTLLTFMGDAGFYFLPIIVGISSSMKLNMPWSYGAYIGAIMLHPTFTALAGQPFKVFGIPCNVQSYASTVIPILAIVWVMSYIYRFFRKLVPDALQLIFVPFITLLMITPIALCLIGPAGSFLGNYIAGAIIGMNDVFGPLAVALVGGLFLPLVFTGMHVMFYMYLFTTFPTIGYDSFFLPGTFASSWVILGLWLACLVKFKKKENKAYATGTFLTWILGGVGEPFMFGILLKNKKLLLASCVAGAIAGFVAGLLHLTAYALAPANGIYSVLAFMGGPSFNYVAMAITVLVSAGCAFAAAVILGVEED